MTSHLRLKAVFVFVICGSAMMMALAACGPNPNKAPAIPKLPETLAMKPTTVGAAHVTLTAITELARVERALKPLVGSMLSETAPAEIAATPSCKSTQTTNLAMWETTWKCGVDATVRGRKEVEGVERINFDNTKRLLTYEAKFETRNYEDLEPKAKAHTLVTARKIEARFERGSTTASARADLRMSSAASTSTGVLGLLGSNWSANLEGTLLRQDSSWTLARGALFNFSGALYGVDGERKTAWASGEFNFVSDSVANLTGLGVGSTCMKPEGKWHLAAKGSGEKLDTIAETTEAGGIRAGDVVLPWPARFCEEP